MSWLSEGTQFYITTLLVVYGTALLAALGLNLQYGVTGILNFGYAVGIGAGGYTAALLTLGSSEGTFQRYVFGTHLPFPIPWLAAAVVGCVVSLLLGGLSLRRLRGDYQAIVLLAISVIATRVVENQKGLFNGGAGLANLPQPLKSLFGGSALGYRWFFVALTAAVVALCFLVVSRISSAPRGRVLRAVRDNAATAAALGKDATRLRMGSMLVGGAVSGLSGAMAATFLTAWSPASWLMLVTFTYFTGIILGGAGSHLGVAVGILLVPVGFREMARYLPMIGYPGLIEALQWVAIGVLTILVLGYRPSGVIPERFVPFDADGRTSWRNRRRLVERVSSPQGSTVPPLSAVARPDGKVLRTEAVTHHYGGVVAVDSVTLEVEPGTVTGLIGPNGAGKTTWLNIVAGAIPCKQGRVIFGGEDISGLQAHQVARRGIVRTFQLASVFPSLTTVENLLVGPVLAQGETLRAALAGPKRWTRFEREPVLQAWEIIDRFGLTEVANQRAGTLSGGQQRLTELGRAVMMRPDLLLLDEPMAGVNPSLVGLLLEYLRELVAKGMTIIMVEHDLGVVETICDRVVFMASGRVVAVGSVAEVLANEAVLAAAKGY